MILRAIVRTLCTIELGYYTGQNKGRQNRRRMTRIYSSRLKERCPEGVYCFLSVRLSVRPSVRP